MTRLALVVTLAACLHAGCSDSSQTGAADSEASPRSTAPTDPVEAVRAAVAEFTAAVKAGNLAAVRKLCTQSTLDAWGTEFESSAQYVAETLTTSGPLEYRFEDNAVSIWWLRPITMTLPDGTVVTEDTIDFYLYSFEKVNGEWKLGGEWMESDEDADEATEEPLDDEEWALAPPSGDFDEQLARETAEMFDDPPTLDDMLRIDRERLGRDHPETLARVHGMGVIRAGQGELETAEELFREAMEGRVRALGRDHADTLASMHELGVVLAEMALFDEAEGFVRQAMDGRRRVLGHDDPDTMDSIRTLAAVLRAAGRFADADEVLAAQAGSTTLTDELRIALMQQPVDVFLPEVGGQEEPVVANLGVWPKQAQPGDFVVLVLRARVKPGTFIGPSAGEANEELPTVVGLDDRGPVTQVTRWQYPEAAPNEGFHVPILKNEIEFRVIARVKTDAVSGHEAVCCRLHFGVRSELAWHLWEHHRIVCCDGLEIIAGSSGAGANDDSPFANDTMNDVIGAGGGVATEGDFVRPGGRRETAGGERPAFGDDGRPTFSSFSSDPVLLRYAFDAGDVFQIVFDQDVDAMVRTVGLVMPQKQTMRIEAKCAVTSVQADGTISAILKVTRFSMTASGAIAVAYDSETPESNDPAFEALGAMINVGIPVRMTAQGEILETDLEPMQLAMRRANLAATGMDPEAAISQMFEDAFVQFPREPIRAGETYEAGTMIEDGMRLNVSYRLAAVSGDKRYAILEPIMDLAFGDNDMRVEELDNDGWLLLDLSTGLVERGEAAMHLNVQTEQDGVAVGVNAWSTVHVEGALVKRP